MARLKGLGRGLDVLLGEGLGDTDGVALTDDELLALGELVADGHAV